MQLKSVISKELIQDNSFVILAETWHLGRNEYQSLSIFTAEINKPVVSESKNKHWLNGIALLCKPSLKNCDIKIYLSF
jgi:hypothetical protein